MFIILQAAVVCRYVSYFCSVVFHVVLLRLMVECRYRRFAASPMSGGPVLASAGYMVRSPSLPPYLLSEGRFGVQLLISMGKLQ